MSLPVAEEVVILAVEAADVVSVGGSMTEAVEAVLPAVVSQVQALLGEQGRSEERIGRPARARSD